MNANEPEQPESNEQDEALAKAAAEADIKLAAENAPESEADVVAQLQSDVAVARDQALRAAAEMENLRKRSARDVEDARKYATANFAKELVAVLDNLQRATESVPADAREGNEQLNSLATGVEMTLRSLEGAFEKFGITKVSPLGEKFDPNLHQAMVQIESPDAEAGTVVQVMQAGYVIHDRLLRPAMVGVAKAPVGGEPHVDTKA